MTEQLDVKFRPVQREFHFLLLLHSRSIEVKDRSDTMEKQTDGARNSQEWSGTMKKESSGAAGTQTITCSHMRVKEENDGDSTVGHLHQMKVKFSPTDFYKYTIDCDQPRTVLEAIKSTERHKKMKCSDETIMIQLGKEDKKYIVATHFPCTCIREGESLILSYESEMVESAQDQQDITQPRHKYSVFYIDTVGGLNTRQKKLFRNNAVTQFKYLCVYGEKGITVEEALRRDGRFLDNLGNFFLSDNKNPSCRTEHTQKVDNLDKKEFKLCLPRRTRKNDEKHQEKAGASRNLPQKRKRDTKPLDDVVKQRGVSVRAVSQTESNNMSTAAATAVDNKEIYEILRKQFPPLREWMESRFPPDYYQKELDLKKEDFGKIQRLFSEVHRVKKMIKLGESVCKVVVQDVTGTGFVLFDNYILTNAHILKKYVDRDKLKAGINVDIFFNYDDPEPNMNFNHFQAQREVYCSEGELDYAILGLNLEGQNQSETEPNKMPPGLLNKIGERPTTGEACLIGHPAGQLKKIDPTCIIEKEKREQTVHDHFEPYKDKRFIIHLITHLKEQGIENIMRGGNKADKATTYNTFMYHGASGSPVFDANGNVFGLHTGGYIYGYPFHTESVIEYAQPVLTIFEHFVRTMTERENVQDLLKRIAEEANGNSELEKVFESVVKGSRYDRLLELEPADPDEHSDYNESMDTCFYVRCD